MPQWVRDIFARIDVGIAKPVINIVLVLILGYLVLKLIDTGLNRLTLIIPPGGRTRARPRKATN
jgi:hypothetical protein